MSKPREYYYWDIKKWLGDIDRLPNRERVQDLRRAVEEVNSETLKKNNGQLRMKAVKAILFDKRSTYIGMAQELDYDWRTIQNWVTAYINQVGKKAGF